MKKKLEIFYKTGNNGSRVIKTLPDVSKEYIFTSNNQIIAIVTHCVGLKDYIKINIVGNYIFVGQGFSLTYSLLDCFAGKHRYAITTQAEKDFKELFIKLKDVYVEGALDDRIVCKVIFPFLRFVGFGKSITCTIRVKDSIVQRLRYDLRNEIEKYE